MKVAKIGDENAAKPSSMGWCQSERFGLKLNGSVWLRDANFIS
jgi:hypothetical protein